MTTLTWPTTLPLPQWPDYELSPQENTIRTQMEQGEAKQRKRFTSSPAAVPCEFRFTGFQKAIFDSWYNFKAKEGSEYFIIDLQNGIGVVPHQARFVGIPLSRANGADGWIVTATLETRDRPMFTEAELDVLLIFDADRLVNQASTLTQTVNTLY